MGLLSWIVLGLIAGYLAGFLVRGDEGLGIIGHMLLGIVGASSAASLSAHCSARTRSRVPWM